MGDYITAPAIGTRLAGDIIDGKFWSSSKIAFGPDDTATVVSEDTPLPTNDAAVLAAIEALLPGTGTLPAGAATDAKLELIRLLLAGVLNVSVSASALPAGAATAAAQEAMRVLLAGTLAVSAQALPLPAGAATSAAQEAMRLLLAAGATGAKQDTGNTALAAIVTALAGTLATLPIIKPWAAWATTTAIDMRNYAGVEIQVTTAGAAAFTRSADDLTYAAISATALGVAVASPLSLGFYNLKGGGYVKFTGTASVLVRGYN